MAKLTVVTDDSAPSVPSSIRSAVDLDELNLLRALRRKAASEIDAGVPAHTLAPLMRQLRDLDKEIRALELRSAEEGDQVAGSDADDSFDASAI